MCEKLRKIVLCSLIQGRIQGGQLGRSPPQKPKKVTVFTMILYNLENRIRDIRPFAVFCFVTAVLWSIHHLSYQARSQRGAMGAIAPSPIPKVAG